MKIKENPEQIIPYLEDSSNFKHGKAKKIYIPENELEVISVLQDCAKEKIPVTISAAGTGNVAGRIPLDGVVLSTEALNKIVKIDVENKTAVLQAGVRIEDFLSEVDKYDLFYPPFPTERNAFIGGNVATNASGEYSFRFGPTRDYVNRIRVVLTTGDVLDIPRGRIFENDGIINYGIFKIKLPSYRTPNVKCSAGYYSKDGMDAIDLLIGSEGTLGVITEVEVKLIDKLPERFIMMLFFTDEQKMLEVVNKIKLYTKHLNAYSLEFFDKNSLEFIKDYYNFIIPDTCSVYVEAEKNYIDRWVEIVESDSCISTVVAESFTDYKKLVELRYKLPERINSYFKSINSQKIAVDAAVPKEKFEEFFFFYKNIQNQHPQLKNVLFGHIGENHLHFNLFPLDEQQKQLAEEIYVESIKKAVSLGGTGFAEHGIGKLKNKYLHLMYDKNAIFEMAKIKKVFDPAGILNLNNIFPEEILKSLT
ncbi:MAG: FAD-binding oxidoreductase [Endomicrobia bacterium]|nr:FAD-binding oxidoreductase [Endomicrobiia bacterium]